MRRTSCHDRVRYAARRLYEPDLPATFVAFGPAPARIVERSRCGGRTARITECSQSLTASGKAPAAEMRQLLDDARTRDTRCARDLRSRTFRLLWRCRRR